MARMSSNTVDAVTQHIGSANKNIETKIRTRNRVLIIRPQLDSAVGSFYFAMDKPRSLNSYLSRLLAAVGKSRGPFVYLGGGWHPYSTDPTESHDSDPEGEGDSKNRPSPSPVDNVKTGSSSAGVSNPFNQESISDGYNSEQPRSVTPRLVTHPPERIISTVEQLDFEYYGIDPDTVGIERIRKDTARSVNVFDKVPDALLGNVEWTPELATLDDIEWSVELPPSAKEEVPEKTS